MMTTKAPILSGYDDTHNAIAVVGNVPSCTSCAAADDAVAVPATAAVDEDGDDDGRKTFPAAGEFRWGETFACRAAK